MPTPGGRELRSEIAYGAYFTLFLNECIQYLHLGPFNQHDFKGWGENQRIMLHDKT